MPQPVGHCKSLELLVNKRSTLDIGPLRREFLTAAECPPDVQLTRLKTLVQTLQEPTYFVSGIYPTAIQWTSTTLTTILFDYAMVTADSRYFPNGVAFFFKQPVLSLTCQKNDDKLWVVLTYLRGAAYAQSHDKQWVKPFLKRAKGFYRQASSGWDNSNSGGGMYWGGGSKYKNAVTTELWISASIGMYEAFKEESMLQAAIRAWAWFNMSGMINSEGLVNDGLDNNCK